MGRPPEATRRGPRRSDGTTPLAAAGARHSISTVMPDDVDLSDPCDHLPEVKIRAVKRPARGCEDCLKIGGRWVHLRECLTCGHVGCCDASPNRHATRHYRSTEHPIVA